jgi:hypothetical protein
MFISLGKEFIAMDLVAVNKAADAGSRVALSCLLDVDSTSSRSNSPSVLELHLSLLGKTVDKALVQRRGSLWWSVFCRNTHGDTKCVRPVCKHCDGYFVSMRWPLCAIRERECDGYPGANLRRWRRRAVSPPPRRLDHARGHLPADGLPHAARAIARWQGDLLLLRTWVGQRRNPRGASASAYARARACCACGSINRDPADVPAHGATVVRRRPDRRGSRRQ